MELITHLSPGVYNGVKFVILYILVDNLLVWARAKLKRAVYVADLIHGVPVPIESITDNNGRNTVVDVFYILEDTVAGLVSGCSTEADSNRSETRKWMCRTCSVSAIRLVPLLILILVLLLDFGTGDTRKCKHKKVQFDDAWTEAGVLAGSLKCTHLREEESNRNGTGISFRVEYVESVLHQNSYFCGCKSSTQSVCMSSYNNLTSKGPRVAVWNTSLPVNNSMEMERLQEVRDEFAFPGIIPWKNIIPENHRKAMNDFFLSCFIYSDVSRLSVACVREYALAYRFKEKMPPVIFNEVLLFAKTNFSISYVQYYSMGRNQTQAKNLAGALDGSKSVALFPLVYRSNSESVHRLPWNQMFGFLYFLMRTYRLVSRNLYVSEASSAELARLITAYTGAKRKGEGTLRYCSGGAVLTLETLGIVSAALLILLFLLMCAFSLIKSPESPLALISRSDAFESWNWVLQFLLSEKAGFGMSWSAYRTDEIAILVRAPELQLKITNRENQLSACTCTPSEIKSMI